MFDMAYYILRPWKIHKGGERAENISSRYMTVEWNLQVRVTFLSPGMMLGAVNKSSGMLKLQTKPDGQKQFTKEHILPEKLGHLVSLLTRYRKQLVSVCFVCCPFFFFLKWQNENLSKGSHKYYIQKRDTSSRELQLIFICNRPKAKLDRNSWCCNPSFFSLSIYLSFWCYIKARK